jgi:hypothetical protein
VFDFSKLEWGNRMAKNLNGSIIEIYVDDVWGGSGKLRGSPEDGVQIVDCGAQFCDDQDKSEKVYEEIEDCIETGVESFDFEGKEIKWTINGPS